MLMILSLSLGCVNQLRKAKLNPSLPSLINTASPSHALPEFHTSNELRIIFLHYFIEDEIYSTQKPGIESSSHGDGGSASRAKDRSDSIGT